MTVWLSVTEGDWSDYFLITLFCLFSLRQMSWRLWNVTRISFLGFWFILALEKNCSTLPHKIFISHFYFQSLKWDKSYLQPLNSSKSNLLANGVVVVIGVTHGRELWYKEIVTCVIRRRVLFDVGKFNKLEIERNLCNCFKRLILNLGE